MQNHLTQFRQDLHQIPETSFTEFKTQKYLKNALQNMGYQPVEVAGTGLYVYIDNHNFETIAFRTDIDGLPLQEENNIPFKSTHNGYMHACGHDGHMAMMLGVADYLKDKQDQLDKNVLLLFQPAEESTGGAKIIVDTGIFKTFNVQAIFGIHLYPDIEQGTLASKPLEFMAMVNEVDVEIVGKSAHGAMPHMGIDANIILSSLLLDFQTIQSRMISPIEPTILTFGKITGGNVRNQISDYAKMEGTVRSFSTTTHKKLIDMMNHFARQKEDLYNCKITVTIKDGYPPVINNDNLYKMFTEAIKDLPYHEFKQPVMIAEDFAFYQQEVPGVFFFLGTKNEQLGFTKSLHHPEFNFNEDVLQIGVLAYQKLLFKLGVTHE